MINGFEDALHVGGLDAFKTAAAPRCVKKPMTITGAGYGVTEIIQANKSAENVDT